jgi:hypothetical protein
VILDAYEAWLHQEGYQDSTIQVTLRHIKAVSVQPERHPGHRAPHVRRYLRFVAKTRKNPLGRPFVERMLGHGLAAASDIEKQGARDKDCLTESQWKTLRANLRGGDPIARLLVAYMESPFRIGDFLNLQADRVTADDVSDKISRDWIRRFGGKKKLYKMLCPTQRCAYYRLRRRLQIISTKMKVATDLDTLYKTYHENASENAA